MAGTVHERESKLVVSAQEVTKAQSKSMTNQQNNDSSGDVDNHNNDANDSPRNKADSIRKSGGSKNSGSLTEEKNSSLYRHRQRRKTRERNSEGSSSGRTMLEIKSNPVVRRSKQKRKKKAEPSSTVTSNDQVIPQPKATVVVREGCNTENQVVKHGEDEHVQTPSEDVQITSEGVEISKDDSHDKSEPVLPEELRQSLRGHEMGIGAPLHPVPSPPTEETSSPRPGAYSVMGVDGCDDEDEISHQFENDDDDDESSRGRGRRRGGEDGDVLVEATVVHSITTTPHHHDGDDNNNNNHLINEDVDTNNVGAPVFFAVASKMRFGVNFQDKRVRAFIITVGVILLSLIVGLVIALAVVFGKNGKNGQNINTPNDEEMIPTMSPTTMSPTTMAPTTMSPTLPPTALMWSMVGDDDSLHGQGSNGLFGSVVSISDDGTRVAVAFGGVQFNVRRHNRNNRNLRQGRRLEEQRMTSGISNNLVKIYEYKIDDESPTKKKNWVDLGTIRAFSFEFNEGEVDIAMSGDGNRIAVCSPGMGSMGQVAESEVVVYEYDETQSRWVLVGNDEHYGVIVRNVQVLDDGNSAFHPPPPLPGPDAEGNSLTVGNGGPFSVSLSYDGSILAVASVSSSQITIETGGNASEINTTNVIVTPLVFHLSNNTNNTWTPLGDSNNPHSTGLQPILKMVPLESKLIHRTESISLSSDGKTLAIGNGVSDSTDGINDAVLMSEPISPFLGRVQYLVDNRFSVFRYDDSNQSWSSFGFMSEDSTISKSMRDVSLPSAISLSGDGSVLALGGFQEIVDDNEGQQGRRDEKNLHVVGHVLVYRYDTNDQTWKVMESIKDAGSGYTFGTAVSLSRDGSILGVGDDYYRGSFKPDCGRVLVYQHQDVNDNIDNTTNANSTASGSPSWVLVGEGGENTDSILQCESANDRFGLDLSLSGDGHMVIVGAPHSGKSGDNSGHASVFQLRGDSL